MLEIQKKEFLGHFYNYPTKEETNIHIETTQEFVNLLLEILEFLNFEYHTDFNFENLLGLSNIKNLKILIEDRYFLPDFLQDKITNYLGKFKNNQQPIQEYYYPSQKNNPLNAFNQEYHSILSFQFNPYNEVQNIRILKNMNSVSENITKELIDVSAFTIKNINKAISFSLSKGERHKFSNQIIATFLKLSIVAKSNSKFKTTYQEYFHSNKFGHNNYKINLMLPIYKEHNNDDNNSTKKMKYSKFLFSYNELKYNYIQYILIKKVLTYVKTLSVKNAELEVPIPNHNVIKEILNH